MKIQRGRPLLSQVGREAEAGHRPRALTQEGFREVCLEMGLYIKVALKVLVRVLFGVPIGLF